MATGRVLIADSIHVEAIEKLKSAGLDVVEHPDISAEQLLTSIGAFDAVVVRSRTKITAQVIATAKRLKVIARAGVGLDNIDLVAAKNSNLQVINSPEGPSVAVAELVFAFALNVLRKISFSHHGMTEGKWLKKESKGGEMRGRTIGIIGFGLIGEEVAKRALAFDMKVLAFDILPERINVMKKLGIEFCETSELIKSSDILTVHVPLTPKTKGLIGKREIAMMRPGAILINTARGGIIDEDALYNGLMTGPLGGAGIDVFSEEPPHDNVLLTKLIALPTVISTPHIGAQTVEASKANSMIIAEKLLKLLS